MLYSTESHDRDGEEEDGESEKTPSATPLLRNWYSDPVNLKRVYPDRSVLQQIASQTQQSMGTVDKCLQDLIRQMVARDAFPQELEEGYVFERFSRGADVKRSATTHFMLMRQPLAAYPTGLAALGKGLNTLIEQDQDHLKYGGAHQQATPRHESRFQSFNRKRKHEVNDDI